MLLALARRPQAPYPRCGLGNCRLYLALRQYRNGSASPSKPGQKRKQYNDKEKSLSLLEELFPEEAKFGQDAKPQREIPRLPLDLPNADEQKDPQKRNGRANRFSARSQELYQQMKEQGEQVAVLVLRNASKNLVEEDFQRLIPKGKHIEGWNLEKGDVLKVIPGRDLTTLERLNYYYLLFKSPLSAFTYQGRVTRIANLVSQLTPTSLTSPMAPPKGFWTDGEDVHELMQLYALTPPSQKPNIRQLAPPLATVVQQIAMHQGYPEIVKRRGRSAAEVVIRLEGPQLPVLAMRGAFMVIERERGLPWTGSRPGSFTITKWEGPPEHLSPLSKKNRGTRRYQGVNGDEDPEFAQPRDEDERQERDRLDQRAIRTGPASFIIGLGNEAEAQTFVRYWHRKSLEVPDYEYKNGDIAPVVDAEILW